MMDMMEVAPASAMNAVCKPFLMSHDSGEECSLDHWLTVQQMVEDEFILTFDETMIEWQADTRN